MTALTPRFSGWHKRRQGNWDAGPVFAQVEKPSDGHGNSFCSWDVSRQPRTSPSQAPCPATIPLTVGRAKSSVLEAVTGQRRFQPTHCGSHSIMLLVTTHPSLIIGTVLWMGLGPQGVRALLGRGGLFTRLVGDAVPQENAKLSHERGVPVPLCPAHLAGCCTSSASRVAGLQSLC